MVFLAPPEVTRALETRFAEALEQARSLLRQPSVSATGEGIPECAEMVRQMMTDIGCKTRLWSKGGHPLVVGDLDVGAPVTLVEYEMYDVQPVGDLTAWKAPPFAAEIHDIPSVGRSIIARGSTNSKGALANHLFTWKTIRDVDEMPVNLKILAEGEEEISSANFIEYIRTHRRELRAQGAIANDYSEDLRGVPTVYLGVKGCLYLTIWSRGDRTAGGPMDGEIHSSDAVWIASPVWPPLQALDTILQHEAYATVDIRLVKDMTVGGTLRNLRAHFAKRGFGDLRIDVHGPYGPARTDPPSWIARAAIETVEAHGKVPEVWPSSGGTMPAFAFDEYLHLPWVATGLGHGAHAHAPNEYASIDGMRRFIAAEATLVYTAAKRGKTVAK